jgi:ABC-2 type transport system ATP-binding protein
VNNLLKRFGDFIAVREISFTVEEGQIFGFLGPNGAGKSTTIRMLCGLLRPDGGQARVAQVDVVHRPEAVRARLGYMPQSFSLYGDLTVRENLELYAALYGVTRERFAARLEELTQRLELADMLDRLTRELSTGWRQRVALAAALVHEPPLAFLDEPTSGVDPLARRLFWEVIDDLAAVGTTVFVTTHVMDEAEHCTQLAMMYDGSLIAQGSPEEMRANYAPPLLEVHARPLWEALSLLGKSELAGEVALFGDALHVELRERKADGAALAKELTEAGLAVESVAPVSPTMEDVFVHLVQEYRAGAGRETP